MSEDKFQEVIKKYKLEVQFARVSQASPYVVDVLNKYSAEFVFTLENGFWLSEPDYTQQVGDALPYFTDIIDSTSDTQCKQALRKFRNFHSARLLWLDLNELVDWQNLLKAQSDLADLCVHACFAFLEKEFQKKYLSPKYVNGDQMQLSLIAMGKWGGRELNFSSDIDFILLYGEKVSVQGKDGLRDIETHQYFIKFSQRLIRLLDDKTADGFVYRCDTRLRPFGDSGPLVVSVAALEQYLTQHGREWERYAYLKARCITGDTQVRDDFESLRKPFVYRRYLDYGVFEKLRDMHAQIAQQVQKKEMQGNLKLGAGGIRECEFLVQTMQLLRGGRINALQQTNFLAAYTALQENQVWEDDKGQLLSAYVYLRLIENRLQAIQQEQTHQLPSDEYKRECLLAAMQLNTWDNLLKQLNTHREIVKQCFAEQMSLLNISNDELIETKDFYTSLVELEYKYPEVFSQTVDMQASRWYKNLSENGRARLHALFTLFFIEIEHYKNAKNFNDGVKNFYNILRAIGRRAVYFSLLVERPAALKQLLKVCFTSDYLSTQIALRPILLDELLDARVFQQIPVRQDIIDSINKFSAQSVQSDLEKFVNDLVVHKHVQMFRIACADVFQNMPLMKVSDCLSDLAESILHVVVNRVLKETLLRYSLPDLSIEESGFAILAYGKLGGLELSYTSDLDIVFLFDSTQVLKEHALYHKPEIQNRFYTRMVQQCISYLNMPTSMGRLYEVDTRLRPSGRSGFLISSIEAFDNYQRKEAWVWEHQALSRARVVLGSVEIKNTIEQSRVNILQHSVKRENLANEIISMREKMRAQFAKNNSDIEGFHIKHSKGGMIDCEFLVQYLILEHSALYASLLEYSDNIRQLEALAERSIITQSEAQLLITSYINLREKTHHLSLQNKDPVVNENDLPEARHSIEMAWDKYLASQIAEN